jgi:hypothetical protein
LVESNIIKDFLKKEKRGGRGERDIPHYIEGIQGTNQ